MARRPALIAKKNKKVRITRSESYLVNVKYLGEEPVFTKPLTDSDYGKALSWYNYMCTNSDAREYIETYLKSMNKTAELKKFKSVPDVWVPTTLAWICRMLTRGYTLPDSAKGFFEEKMKETLARSRVEKVVVKVENKISIQDRIRERGHDIVGEIEEMIDKGEKFSLYDWLKSNEIPANYCTHIINRYTPWLAELIEAYEGKDAQLKEAYGYMKKAELKERILFFNTLIEEAEKYGNVTKKTRAPRKPRPVSVEKKLKGLKYQKEDNNFKVASINPEKIIGAQELWTFNTKYKILTVFRALDRGGLDVKGTSIIGFDEKTSCSKRTGRKPEYFVQKVMTGGKVALRKLMDEAKGDAQLAVRINDATILLKAEKS